MSERDDDADFTARVLDASAQVSVSDERGAERAEIERAAQALRLTLRNTDVAGLDASMREAILRRADRRSRVRTWPLLLAASLGGAVVAALALYFGVMVPAQERAAEAERMERERVAAQLVAEERLAEERVHTAMQQAEARMAAERAAAAAQAWADTASAGEAAKAASRAAGGGAPAVGGRAGKASGAGRSSGGGKAESAGGGCDPNDPLCGL